MDAALAAEGVPRHEWLAMRWCELLDESVKWEVYDALLKESARMAVREKWPDTIQGRAYLDRMVRYAMAEARESREGRRLRTIVARSADFEVSPRTWGRQYAKYHEAIYNTLTGWRDSCLRTIQKRIG